MATVGELLLTMASAGAWFWFGWWVRGRRERPERKMPYRWTCPAHGLDIRTSDPRATIAFADRHEEEWHRGD